MLKRDETPGELVRLWHEQSTEAANEAVIAAISSLPTVDEQSEYVRTTLSFPDDMAASLEQLLGLEAAAAGSAFNRQAPTTIRVNPLRTRVDRVVKALPDAVQSLYSPWALELPKRVNIHDQSGYREGWYEIQEEASQLAALLTDVRPGMTVVDVGAGAGGKTLALAAMMGCEGTLVALDHSERRLDELRERARRAKAQGIEQCRVRVATDGTWVPAGQARLTINRLQSSADCVFVDAPCTGSGAIRRSPDAKWRHYDAGKMSQDQQQLLEQSAALVARGGCLIYVTCAFERYQNEEVVDRFLSTKAGKQFDVEPGVGYLEAARDRAAVHCMGAKHSSWQREPLDDLFSGPYLRTWPHRHGTDAFFGARLRRG
jgi:16S rRNA (cytosine967-C5)-methyltransferase